MPFGELVRFSKGLLKDRRSELTLICLLPVCASLSCRAAETAACCLLLYFFQPENGALSLFSGDILLQTLFTAALSLLRLIIVSPLYFAAAERLWSVCCEGQSVPLTQLLSDKGFILRSILVQLLRRLISAAALAPALLTGYQVYRILSGGGGTDELFLALHLSVLTLILLSGWIWVITGTSAAPFLAAEYHESPLRTVFRSFRLLRGRKKVILRIFIRYFIPAAAIAPLPELGLCTGLCTAIFLREDEYRRNTAINGAEVKQCRKLFLHRRAGSLRP
ncbi:MAG: hypothetical protein IJ874_04150 [Ruminococcus sp.]|nr:hypothetical protein [Ruminococcus sp.]